MLESEFTGSSTKIVNYGVEKLRLQQKQKVDTVFWSYQQTQKQTFLFSSLDVEIIQSKHSCFVRQSCTLPLAGNMVQLL